jgi:hypothetical protein
MDFELAKQKTKVKFKLNEFSVCELHLASPVALIENFIQNFFLFMLITADVISY